MLCCAQPARAAVAMLQVICTDRHSASCLATRMIMCMLAASNTAAYESCCCTYNQGFIALGMPRSHACPCIVTHPSTINPQNQVCSSKSSAALVCGFYQPNRSFCLLHGMPPVRPHRTKWTAVPPLMLLLFFCVLASHATHFEPQLCS